MKSRLLIFVFITLFSRAYAQGKMDYNISGSVLFPTEAGAQLQVSATQDFGFLKAGVGAGAEHYLNTLYPVFVRVEKQVSNGFACYALAGIPGFYKKNDPLVLEARGRPRNGHYLTLGGAVKLHRKVNEWDLLFNYSSVRYGMEVITPEGATGLQIKNRYMHSGRLGVGLQFKFHGRGHVNDGM